MLVPLIHLSGVKGGCHSLWFFLAGIAVAGPPQPSGDYPPHLRSAFPTVFLQSFYSCCLSLGWFLSLVAHLPGCRPFCKRRFSHGFLEKTSIIFALDKTKKDKKKTSYGILCHLIDFFVTQNVKMKRQTSPLYNFSVYANGQMDT